MAPMKSVTAALLIIGDEILSGRTQDQNIRYIGGYLGQIGIELREARIVRDVTEDIVAAVNGLRQRFTYLFTTGGIGPTHDDITADAIASALGVEISEDERAIALMLERIKAEDLNAARRRMARIPHGARLVRNKISAAPGFWIENVIVLAGVPAIMQSMLDDVAPRLCGSDPMQVVTIAAHGLPEGAYATELGGIAASRPELSIGSYPAYRDGGFKNEVVVRGKNRAEVDATAAAIGALIERVKRDLRS